MSLDSTKADDIALVIEEAIVSGELERVEAAAEAKELFAEVALAEELPEFLTLVGYPQLPDG